MLSWNLIPVFLEFISVVDFERKIREFCLKFMFADACLVEEMENEFLGIRELFPDGR